MEKALELERFFVLEKRSVVEWLFSIGMFIAYFSSLYPWFLWWFYPYFPIVTGLFLLVAMVLSSTISKPLFQRNDFLLPVLAYIVLGFYQRLVNADNVNGYITTCFNVLIFYALFRYNTELLHKLSTLLSKAMACLMLVSIPFFILYILGFPLPYVDLQFRDAFYTFSNYYFFLIDDRQLLLFIPRFQSVFLEPSHLGTALVLLLQTQRGHWRRWYNIVMLVGTLLTFSLGAYIYLIVVVVTNLWIKGRHIFAKVFGVSLLVTLVVVGSFFYNDGDNLLHNLIVLRLEIDDGEMAGYNRTTEEFDADYENFLGSSDIMFGRDKENTFGDSGYKVFIYDYGFVGLFLLIVFFGMAFYRARNKRAMISALFVAALVFGVDAAVLWYNRFIPLFCTAYSESEPTNHTISEQT